MLVDTAAAFLNDVDALKEKARLFSELHEAYLMHKRREQALQDEYFRIRDDDEADVGAVIRERAVNSNIQADLSLTIAALNNNSTEHQDMIALRALNAGALLQSLACQ